MYGSLAIVAWRHVHKVEGLPAHVGQGVGIGEGDPLPCLKSRKAQAHKLPGGLLLSRDLLVPVKGLQAGPGFGKIKAEALKVVFLATCLFDQCLEIEDPGGKLCPLGHCPFGKLALKAKRSTRNNTLVPVGHLALACANNQIPCRAGQKDARHSVFHRDLLACEQGGAREGDKNLFRSPRNRKFACVREAHAHEEDGKDQDGRPEDLPEDLKQTVRAALFACEGQAQPARNVQPLAASVFCCVCHCVVSCRW